MLQGRAFLLYFPKGFLPAVGFWSARPLTFRRLKNLSILAHAGNQPSHRGSAHSPFYLLMCSGLVGASFPPFPAKTYFRFVVFTDLITSPFLETLVDSKEVSV